MASASSNYVRSNEYSNEITNKIKHNVESELLRKIYAQMRLLMEDKHVSSYHRRRYIKALSRHFDDLLLYIVSKDKSYISTQNIFSGSVVEDYVYRSTYTIRTAMKILFDNNLEESVMVELMDQLIDRSGFVLSCIMNNSNEAIVWVLLYANHYIVIKKMFDLLGDSSSSSIDNNESSSKFKIVHLIQSYVYEGSGLIPFLVRYGTIDSVYFLMDYYKEIGIDVFLFDKTYSSRISGSSCCIDCLEWLILDYGKPKESQQHQQQLDYRIKKKQHVSSRLAFQRPPDDKSSSDYMFSLWFKLFASSGDLMLVKKERLPYRARSGMPPSASTNTIFECCIQKENFRQDTFNLFMELFDAHGYFDDLYRVQDNIMIQKEQEAIYASAIAEAADADAKKNIPPPIDFNYHEDAIRHIILWEPVIAMM